MAASFSSGAEMAHRRALRVSKKQTAVKKVDRNVLSAFFSFPFLSFLSFSIPSHPPIPIGSSQLTFNSGEGKEKEQFSHFFFLQGIKSHQEQRE